MHTDNKMSFGLRIISEILSYFVGLDLGQSRNHSVLAVVERSELLLDEMDWVTYERRREWRYRMRFLGRVSLDNRELGLPANFGPTRALDRGAAGYGDADEWERRCEGRGMARG